VIIKNKSRQEVKGSSFYKAGSSPKEKDIENNQNALWKNKYKK